MRSTSVRAALAATLFTIAACGDDGQSRSIDAAAAIDARSMFVPTADTEWWLLLRNSGPAEMTVQVRVELYADMQWSWK